MNPALFFKFLNEKTKLKHLKHSILPSCNSFVQFPISVTLSLFNEEIFSEQIQFNLEVLKLIPL